MFPAAPVCAQGYGGSFGQGVPWGFRVPLPPGQSREKSIFSGHIPVCFQRQVSPQGLRLAGLPVMPLEGPTSTQEPFRPRNTLGLALRSSEAGGRGDSGSILGALSATACRRRTQKLRQASAQRKHPFWFPPEYFGIRGSPAGSRSRGPWEIRGPNLSLLFPASFPFGRSTAPTKDRSRTPATLVAVTSGTVRPWRSEKRAARRHPKSSRFPCGLGPPLSSAQPCPPARPRSTRGRHQPRSSPGSAGGSLEACAPPTGGLARVSLSPRPPQPSHRCQAYPGLWRHLVGARGHCPPLGPGAADKPLCLEATTKIESYPHHRPEPT